MKKTETKDPTLVHDNTSSYLSLILKTSVIVPESFEVLFNGLHSQDLGAND